MTIEQIKSSGIVVDKWVSLGKSFTSALFSNEGKMYFSKDNTTRVFIDSKNNLIYVRYFNGIIHKNKQLSNELEIEDYYTGNTVYCKPLGGGIVNKTAGLYHEVYDIGEISILQ